MPSQVAVDTLVWTVAEDGMLTVKRAYKLILKPHSTVAWSSFPWHNNVPSTHYMTFWRYIHKKMPTDDNLKVRGFSLPSMCSICKASEDCAHHIFFDCTFARNLWHWLAGKL